LAVRLENYFRVEVEAVAAVAEERFPLNNLSVTYGLDTVPQAAISVPLGRSPGGDNRVAGAGIFASLLPFTRFQISLKTQATPAGRDAEESGGLPDGDREIFDGYLRSPIMDGAVNKASLWLTGFGSLGGLGGATTLDAGVVVNRMPDGSSVFLSKYGTTDPGITAVEGLLKLNLQASVSASIKSLFAEALEGTSTWLTGIPSTAQAAEAAEIAVKRLTSGGKLDPLRNVSGTSVAEETFNRAVAYTFATTFWNVWAGGADWMGGQSSDLWQILRALQGEFMYRIVPTVNLDYIAPITSGLGGEPNNVLGPGDYRSYRFTSDMVEKSTGRAMYAYITQVGLYSTSFQSSPWNNGSSVSGRVGYARLSAPEGDDLFDRGRLFLYPAAKWLIPDGAIAAEVTGVFDGVPDAAGAVGGGAAEQRVAEILVFQSDLGNNLAKAILHTLVFEHRKLRVSGRLRLDIAPGNLVKIVLPGERFLQTQSDVLFGIVDRVTLNVETNDQGSFASTDIDVTHLRTESEHASFTVPDHPLYRERWDGRTLLGV